MPYINHDVPKEVVTNYEKGRGYETGVGHFIAGAFHVVSLQKEGGGHAEGGGGTNSFEVVLTRELEVSAILMGGGGEQKVCTF